MSALPTGRCQYRLLDQAQTCGCLRFRIRRSAAADEDEEVCRCDHDSCFHKLETTPPTSFVVPHKPAEEETDSTRRLTQSMDGFATSRGASGFSIMSGTSTERDTVSTSATPHATFLKPAFPPAPRLPPARTTSVPTATAERGNALQVMERMASVGAGRGRATSTVSAVSAKSDIASVRGTLKTLIDATKELRSNAISHSDRLETIENLPSALEELAEKIDTLDERIDERYYSFEAKIENQLEARFADVDTFMRRQTERKRRRKADERADNSSVHSDPRRRKGHENEIGVTTRRTTTTSFTTSTSTSTSFSTPGPMQSKDDEITTLRFQIEQIKNRITDVETNGPPTQTRPWDVEVVLIPPSPHVRGAWTDAGSSAASTQVGSELGPSAGTAIASNNSPKSGVLPRSFSVNSKTYRRLYSRGFVRRIHITGPTAMEVSLAIESSFEHLFAWCQSLSSSSQQSFGYKGSRSSTGSSFDSQRTARPPVRGPGWVPLRKIYKQTVLEYLPKSDISTPALWTVDYLKVNCMMRSSSRRVIYILPTVRTSITWGDIRRLDRYHDQDAVQENSIEDSESCWEFDFKLDKKLAAPNDSFFSQPFANFAAEESLNNRSSQDSTPRQRLIGPAPPPLEDEIPARDETTQRDDSPPPHHDAATPPDTSSANPQLRPRKRSKLNSKPATPAPSKSQPTSRATSRATSQPAKGTTSQHPRPLSPPSTLPATTAPRRRLRSYKSPPLPPLQENQKSPSTTQQDSSPPVFEDEGERGDTSTMREGGEHEQALMALFQSMEDEDRDEESAGSSEQARATPAPLLAQRKSGSTKKGDSGDGGYISD